MKFYNLALTLVALFVSICINAQKTYTRYTNLPTMYVETFDGYGITSKTVEKYARIVFVDEEDVVTEYDSVLVRGRGNSTWNMRKKPYRIKFNEKEKFLGKGHANAKKWTLLANAGDKSLIRNAVTSSMGEWLGLKFNPAYKFIDLDINGQYIGNYQVSDQVEVRKHRVDVEEQDYPVTPESDITGGYLLEVDGFKDGNCFTTSKYQVPVRIHYPEADEISQSQNQYIRGYMKDFESVLSSNVFDDAKKGYRGWVDSVSLANWYIATEVSANIDGFYSTYFYKNQGDSLLYWGPLWDYDIAYGNDTRKGDTSRRLMTEVGYGQTRLWMLRMWEDPWFARLINRRYNKALDEGLTEHMLSTIDSLQTLLDESQQMNYRKWGIDTKMYNERVLWSSYRQYLVDLRSFINTHNSYLKTTFENMKPAEPTPPFVPGNFYYRMTNAGNGNAIDVTMNGASVYQVCAWNNSADRLSQEWMIKSVDESYYMLINRETGLALNDPTVGASTATTNTGTQLNTAEPNVDDYHQHWTLTAQGMNGYYNLTNRATEHTANLNGGGSANGTHILSYTTDSRNASSNNRLWYVVAGDEYWEEEKGDEDEDDEEDNKGDDDDEGDNEGDEDEGDNEGEGEDPGVEDFIAGVEPEEYALAYNEEGHTLRFGSETPEELTFIVHIYSIDGKMVGTFCANESYDTSALGKGTFIITWTCGGEKRSVKALLNN